MLSQLSELLARARKSLFVRGLLVITAGTALGQLVPVLSAPVLTRLYGPAQYGHYARFMLAVAVLSGAASGRYEMAILAPREDRDAKTIRQLALTLSVVVSLLILAAIGVLFAVDRLSIGSWVWLVPAGTFTTATLQVFNSWQLRARDFRQLSASRVVRSLLVALASIALGLLGFADAGLVLGSVAGTALVAAALFVADAKSGDAESSSRAALKGAAVEHRQFPLFSLPAEWLSTLATQLPLVMLDAHAAGLFSFCNTVIYSPLALVGASVQESFKERAFRDFREQGNFRAVYRGVFLLLLLPAVSGALVLLAGAPFLFRKVFGAEWEGAGVFAQYLAPMFALRLLASPLSHTYFVVGRQREGLSLQAYALVSTAIVLFASQRWALPPRMAILVFGLNYCVVYAVFLGRTWKLAHSSGGPDRTEAAGGPPPS